MGLNKLYIQMQIFIKFMCDWVIVNFCLVTSEGKLCLYDYKHEECTLKMYLLECLPNLALSLVEGSNKKFPLKIPNN